MKNTKATFALMSALSVGACTSIPAPQGDVFVDYPQQSSAPRPHAAYITGRCVKPVESRTRVYDGQLRMISDTVTGYETVVMDCNAKPQPLGQCFMERAGSSGPTYGPNGFTGYGSGRTFRYSIPCPPYDAPSSYEQRLKLYGW